MVGIKPKTQVQVMDADAANANELDELSALLDSGIENNSASSTQNLPVRDNDRVVSYDIDIFKDAESHNTLSTNLPVPSLSELFKKEKNGKKQSERSEIHDGDTDSSDDEDNKYFSDQKYSDCGRNIKQLMTKSRPTTEVEPTKNTSWKSNKPLLAPSLPLIPSPSTSGHKSSGDVYTDPYFGIRIITPLISSQTLREKMQGKTAVTFNRLENHIANYDKTSDWVIAGVIVSKTIKTSQKGKTYLSWSLSDLKEDVKTVNVLLFGKAYQALWKTNTHVVVAILNPSPLENRGPSNQIASLSVSNADQVMVWGQSKDMGTCRARKKNGESCTMIVNLSKCDYCVYHVKQEYSKFSRRSELQAPSGGSLSQLKNKVLGKNEVFYAGRSFSASVGKPTMKQVAKDQRRLTQLFNQGQKQFNQTRQVVEVKKPSQSARVQLMKDAERLQKLTGTPATLASLGQGNKNITDAQSHTNKADDKVVPLELPNPKENMKSKKPSKKGRFDNLVQTKTSSKAPAFRNILSKGSKTSSNTSKDYELSISQLKDNESDDDWEAEWGLKKLGSHSDEKHNVSGNKNTPLAVDIIPKLTDSVSEKTQNRKIAVTRGIKTLCQQKSIPKDSKAKGTVREDDDDWEAEWGLKKLGSHSDEKHNVSVNKNTPLAVDIIPKLTDSVSEKTQNRKDADTRGIKTLCQQKSTPKDCKPKGTAREDDDDWEAEWGLKKLGSHSDKKHNVSVNKNTPLAVDIIPKLTDSVSEKTQNRKDADTRGIKTLCQQKSTPKDSKPKGTVREDDDDWEAEWGLKKLGSHSDEKHNVSVNKNTPLAVDIIPKLTDSVSEKTQNRKDADTRGIKTLCQQKSTPKDCKSKGTAREDDDDWEAEWGLKKLGSHSDEKHNVSVNKNTPLAVDIIPKLTDSVSEKTQNRKDADTRGIKTLCQQKSTPKDCKPKGTAREDDDDWEAEWGLKKLGSHSDEKHNVSVNKNTPLVVDIIPKLTEEDKILEETWGMHWGPTTGQRSSAAKKKALAYVKRKGPISNDQKASEKKRKRTELEDTTHSEDGKSKLSRRFLELMNTSSKHTSLAEQAEEDDVQEYFQKMEKKEALEEKMLTTFKIDCKAVRCLKCKYKWFSASDKCKAENHPIKVISAVKRFFQCQSCKKRTVTLEIIPLHNCRNCGQGNWIRAPMMKERQANSVTLSIRGGEQTHTNSNVTNANLDLLIPDDS